MTPVTEHTSKSNQLAKVSKELKMTTKLTTV